MKIELSAQARAQIKDIIRYTLREFGPGQADQYVTGLYQTFETLGENPQMGRLWSGKKRRYIYRKHVVYYRILKGSIRITQILHGKMTQPPQ